MSGMVVLLLQKYLKQFSQDGIAKVPNKDVQVCTEQLLAVSARLVEVVTLPHKAAGQILEGFTRCSIVEFMDMHKLLSTTERICQICVAGGKQDSFITFAAIKKLCSKAGEFFHVLNLLNKWNISQGHQHDAAIISCFNYGTPDHTSDKCPQPCDVAKIMKAKEARARANADGHGGPGCGRGGGCGSG